MSFQSSVRLYLAFVIVLVVFYVIFYQKAAEHVEDKYTLHGTGHDLDVDCIIVPGGGQTPDGPPRHMKLRLDGAAEVYHNAKQARKPKIILQSGGTPHKPNPRDADGFDVKEAECSARYLMSERRIPWDAILEEDFSLDTLGNAYWARTIHTDPAGFRNVVVVNNRWHIPRTKAIYNWVFSLPPVYQRPYRMMYYEVGDGLDDDILQIRLEKERVAAPGVKKLIASITTWADYHTFLFSKHGAYSTQRLLKQRVTIDPALAKSY